MSLQAGLLAQLAADAGVSALVGAKFFEGAMPPDFKMYPCVSFAFVGGSAESTLDTSGVIRQRVEMNGGALDYPTADAIRTALIVALNGWQQRLADGFNVLNTTLLNPGTDFVTEQRIFRCMVEFYVLYTLPS